MTYPFTVPLCLLVFEIEPVAHLDNMFLRCMVLYPKIRNDSRYMLLPFPLHAHLSHALQMHRLPTPSSGSQASVESIVAAYTSGELTVSNSPVCACTMPVDPNKSRQNHARNFSDTTRMAPSLKLLCHKSVKHFNCFFMCHKTSRDTKHICVVVLFDQSRHFRFHAKPARTFWCLFAVMATPLAEPQIKIPQSTSPWDTSDRYSVSKIRIIDTFVRVCSSVYRLNILAFKIFYKYLFKGWVCVITTN